MCYASVLEIHAVVCAVKSPSLATDGKCTDEILADQRRRGWVGGMPGVWVVKHAHYEWA